MQSKFRLINLVLAVIVLFEVSLFLQTSTAKAQTSPFLKRPYYGAAVNWNAVFDHHCPDYADISANPTGTCSEQKTYLYTYPDPDQHLNGLGRILKYDGQNAISCFGGGGFCYSGHTGYDFDLVYRPVVASAPGVVTASQWWDPNHEMGYGLYVLIQHVPNYPTHRTLYGHLSMVRYAQGMQVGNWQIGTSGTTGNSTGPHLHFELQYTPLPGIWRPKDMYGWSGNGTDPWQSWQFGVTSEWLWLPLPGREQTPPTYYGDFVLDNDDAYYPNSFVLGCNAGVGAGNCPYWYLVNNGNGYWGDLRYTLPNGTTADYWARWTAPNLPNTGQYEVEAYIPYWDINNRSHAVRYEIMYQYGTHTVVVDQHDVGNGAWISLGRYNFSAGSIHHVRVTDAAYVGGYVDPQNDTKKILVDAIRWRKTH